MSVRQMSLRRGLRAEQARVIVDALHVYLEARLHQVNAKSKLAVAIRYALTRWAGLSLVLGDGRSNWIPTRRAVNQTAGTQSQESAIRRLRLGWRKLPR